MESGFLSQWSPKKVTFVPPPSTFTDRRFPPQGFAVQERVVLPGPKGYPGPPFQLDLVAVRLTSEVR